MNELSAKGEAQRKIFAERLERVANGEATIAQAAGIPKSQLYKIAEKAYLLFTQGRLEEARQIYEGLWPPTLSTASLLHLGATCGGW